MAFTRTSIYTDNIGFLTIESKFLLNVFWVFIPFTLFLFTEVMGNPAEFQTAEPNQNLSSKGQTTIYWKTNGSANLEKYTTNITCVPDVDVGPNYECKD